MIYFTDPHTDLDLIWHLGDPLPALTQRRTVMLQADGDELGVILAALRTGRIVASSPRIHFNADEVGGDPRLNPRIACPACSSQPCRCERAAE